MRPTVRGMQKLPLLYNRHRSPSLCPRPIDKFTDTHLCLTTLVTLDSLRSIFTTLLSLSLFELFCYCTTFFKPSLIIACTHDTSSIATSVAAHCGPLSEKAGMATIASNTTYTPPGGAPGDGTGPVPVTGLGMFWALLAIAANTMDQPTGRICDAPAHINFMLRISPIECVLDTVLMIGRLLYYRFTEGTYQRSANIVIVQRWFFEDDEQSHLPHLYRGTWARWLLSGLAASQAVKVFTSGNSIWTRLWVAFYVAHWLCGEVVLGLKRRLEPEERDCAEPHRFHSNKAYNTPYFAVTTSALFPLYFGALGAAGLAKTKFNYEMSCLQCVGLVVLVFGCLPFLIASIYAVYIERTPSRAAVISSVALILFGGLYSIPWGIKTASSMKETHATAATVTLVVGWSSLGFWWAIWTLRPLLEKDRKYTRRIEAWLAWWLVLIHVASACLYYTCAYKTQGKTRPSWTWFLG